MAIRVYGFPVTIPAGTAQTSPATTALDIDNYALERLDLEVPAGTAGLVGFYVANNGVRWLPLGNEDWIVWDDKKDSWYLTDQPEASGWAVTGYNTGDYDHTVTIRMHVNLPSSQQAPQPVPTVTFVTTPLPQPAVVL